MKEVTVKIVIPTAGRATAITSHKYMANTIICCPQAELDQYKAHNPEAEYFPHPDSVKGIALKRQWIWDKFRNVFMMDDDLKGLKRLTQKAGETEAVDAEHGYYIIQNLANIARLAGAHLFGFNNFVRPEHYHGHQPFALTGYINGCGMGLLEGGKLLKFNPDIKTNNDFFICALNAYHYRKCFIDKRFAFNQDSFANNIGGCADVRTNEAEESDFNILKQFFGAAIEKKTAGLFMPKHANAKNLNIPF